MILIVKSSLALTIGATAVLLALFAGCGQTGPLTMPKQSNKAAPALPTPVLPPVAQ